MATDDIFYQAMLARDHRFDGKFFVGVKTTGIYCRPICPAKPLRKNVEFFKSSVSAEASGYRPCLRCRPESAPHSPAWIGTSAIVRRAIKVISRQETLELDEDRFAGQFGVSARHLRRVFVAEIGKTPKQLSFENRLNLARKLIVESRLPITEVAFAAGFSSIRRFNGAFKERFSKSPSELRRSPLSAAGESSLKLSLSYRPPFDFGGMLHFYESHRVGGLETVSGGVYSRVISFDSKHVGEIRVSNDAVASRLVLEIDYPDSSVLHAILSRTRAAFDLDSDPLVIANAIEKDPPLGRILSKHPGIRLPSGWDPFEVGVAAILGQFVSVAHGRALVAELIRIAGEARKLRDGREVQLFPTPAKLAACDLRSLGTTSARRQTVQAFAREVSEGRLSLEPTQDVGAFLEAVRAIRGIGPWTANYMALKILRHTDAFPETDLILARALELHPAEVIETMSPWRGYVAALLWREYAEKLKMKGKSK